MNLSNTQLFRGLKEAEITSLLECLHTAKRSYQKGEMILSEGSRKYWDRIIRHGDDILQ